jgi:hypothetical protein
MSEKFENEIFISYAHLDNEPLLKGGDGWISNFHRALEIRVAQFRGEKPKIWRDPKLQGNDVLAEELVARLAKVALLVSILTPRYVKSEWCTRELHEFWVSSKKTGGPVIGNKARVFKVVKTPVPPERLPEEVQPLLGYDFFKVDPDTGRTRELDEVWGPEAQREFWVRLDDLAHDIVGLLELLEGETSPSPSQADDSKSRKPKIYLADVTSDLTDEHDTLKRDLLRHGYAVLPDRTLPLIASELETSVREHLARCRVSVHMLGRSYGIVPEGVEESLVALQIRLAQELGREDKLARLIWIPPGLEVKDQRQQRLIEQVRTEPGQDRGADLMDTPIEELKTVLYARLKSAEAQTQAPPGKVACVPGLIRIYLVCDQHDLEAITPLQDYLFGKGFEVILPAFEGDETELREDHESRLRECDALLLFYGSAGDLWLRKKMGEVSKSAALGRTKPMLATAVCIAPPATAPKGRFRTHEALMLLMPEGFRVEALEPFLARIEPPKPLPGA